MFEADTVKTQARNVGAKSEEVSERGEWLGGNGSKGARAVPSCGFQVILGLFMESGNTRVSWVCEWTLYIGAYQSIHNPPFCLVVHLPSPQQTK
jgi:hypothetical protein